MKLKENYHLVKTIDNKIEIFFYVVSKLIIIILRKM